jgi:alpha-ketoglutarate-dependent taurine dioxygenase
MTATTSVPVALDVTPLSGTIGAELRGVDLKQVLAPATVAAIRQALLDHKVIFFPGQYLDAAQHVAFARYFGELTPAHPVIPGIKGFPEVFEIDYTNVSQYKSAGLLERTNDLSWHTDVTFMPRPPLGSILNAVLMPPSGGDTMFADMHAAYDDLSETMRGFLDTLTAVHSGKRQFGAILEKRKAGGNWEGEQLLDLEPVEHPLVRTHPETGRKSLFVNPGFTQRITQLAGQESRTLLDFLYAHSTRPEYTVRYHWRTGDLGFWDNRTTMHSVVRDFGGQARVIQRVTIHGDEPH